MKIQSLTLSNYRCFETIEIDTEKTIDILNLNYKPLVDKREYYWKNISKLCSEGVDKKHIIFYIKTIPFRALLNSQFKRDGM